MKPLSRARVLTVLTLLLAAPRALAQVAVGVKAGTTGAGLDLTVGLTPGLNLRGGVQGFSLSQTRSERDVTYDATLRLRSAMAVLDLHPGGRAFRVSLGGIDNRNERERQRIEDDASSYRVFPVVSLGVTFRL